LGIVIPWFDCGRLVLVKIRRLGFFNGAKYLEAFRDRPRIYPGPEAIRSGTPLIISEGEFDTLLLGQELGGLAPAVTRGSTSSTRPEAAIFGLILPAPVWYVATDSDGAGDGAGDGWPARAHRVRPPAGKDWTESFQAGVDLRRWWIEEVFPLNGPYAIEERAAIQQFG
jgi:hypothetical protein